MVWEMTRISPKEDADRPLVQVQVPDGVGGSKASQLALTGNNAPVMVESGAWWANFVALPARPASVATDAILWIATGNVILRSLSLLPFLWSVLSAIVIGGCLLAVFNLAAQRQFSEPHLVYRVVCLFISVVISFL